jgi:Xaa-Pro aminopeptidase
MYSELFDFQQRLKNVFAQMSPKSLLVLNSNPTATRTGDQDHQYRPSSYILYLIGFQEPDCHLVLAKDQDENTEVLLFVQPKDEKKEIWSGRRVGFEQAKKDYKVTNAFTNSEFPDWFEKNFLKYIKIYYTFGNNIKIDEMVIKLFTHGTGVKDPEGPGIGIIEKSESIIDHLRLIKDKKEIEIMKKACDISAHAHINAMKFIKPGMFEFELENCVNSYFRSQGANGPAYGSICASGENATILHYVENSSVCKDGELLLIDAACEYNYYSSDITRTFPVNGKFTDLQRKIYNIVLKAEKEAINSCTVGNTYSNVHKQTIKIITEGLIELGILQGEVSKLIEEKKYMPYFMHGTGHSLGLDTHDVGRRKIMKGSEYVDRTFEPGMITTIEPGLYFGAIDGLADEFRGIGVRIEDDILITKDGPVILTDTVPREISEIEELMS